MDNAGANKSATVKNYVKSTNGDVVVRHTLPYTPQVNPIELQWSSIKGFADGIYFENFEKMQQYIKTALEGSSRKDGWSDCIWNVGA